MRHASEGEHSRAAVAVATMNPHPHGLAGECDLIVRWRQLLPNATANP
jgi:hypothetical protein